jgi:hypothetical protein
MKYRVTEATNFIRILLVPSELPEDFCFSGGHPTVFTVVDWFNPFIPCDCWDTKGIEFDDTDAEYQKHIEELREFVKGKRYFDPTQTFMALTDYGDAFIINPEQRVNALEEQLRRIKITGKPLSSDALTEKR